MVRVAAWVVVAVLGLLAGFWLTDEATVRAEDRTARCTPPLVGWEETGGEGLRPPPDASPLPVEVRLGELCAAEVTQRKWLAAGAALAALVAGTVALGVSGRFDLAAGGGEDAGAEPGAADRTPV